jgi:hypothetical protein
MGTLDSISRQLIVDLGATPTAGSVRAVSIWLQHESGGRIIGNNPWNLHSWGGLPGQTGYRYVNSGDANVAVFESMAAGVRANANNLLRLANSGYGYDRVIAAIRKGNGPDILRALGNSSWSAGRYMLNGVRGGSLLATWNKGVPVNQRVQLVTPAKMSKTPAKTSKAPTKSPGLASIIAAHPHGAGAAAGVGAIAILFLFL